MAISVRLHIDRMRVVGGALPIHSPSPTGLTAEVQISHGDKIVPKRRCIDECNCHLPPSLCDAFVRTLFAPSRRTATAAWCSAARGLHSRPTRCSRATSACAPVAGTASPLCFLNHSLLVQ